MNDELRVRHGRLGERLRAARHRAAMTLAEVESRSGIHRSRISRYENGYMLPSVPTLTKLARALGTPEGALLSDPRSAGDAFVRVLAQRGITFNSVGQATELANRTADVLILFESAASSLGELGTAIVPRP